MFDSRITQAFLKSFLPTKLLANVTNVDFKKVLTNFPKLDLNLVCLAIYANGILDSNIFQVSVSHLLYFISQTRTTFFFSFYLNALKLKRIINSAACLLLLGKHI